MIILLSLFFSVLSFEYDLLPFTWKNFSVLGAGYEYNLFLEASCTILSITITKDKYSEISFNLSFYESPNKNGQYSFVTQKNYNDSNFKYYDAYKDIMGLLYASRNESTNFILLKLIPKNTISLSIKIDIYGGNYNLLSGHLEKFIDIKRSLDYYYFIKTKHQLVNISLSLNYTEIQPINFISIYEYRDNKNRSLYIKKDTIKFVSKKKENELTSSFLYEISSNLTNYVAFNFKPEFDIDYIYIRMDDIDCTFDLTHIESQVIKNLLNGYPYYFYIKVKQNQIININLTISKNKENTYAFKPFDCIDIYEYTNKSSSSYNQYSDIDFKIKTINDTLYTSLIYKVLSSSSNYISLKIKPNYFIEFIKFEIDISNSGSKANGSNEQFNNKNILLILLIISSSIVFILIIIIIIMCIKNSKKSKSRINNPLIADPIIPNDNE